MSGASGLDLADDLSRWGDLSRRVKTALVLLAIALFCVWSGGILFLFLVIGGCVALVIEWSSFCGHESLSMSVCMLVVIVLAAICGGTGAPAIGLLLVLGGTAVAAFSSWREAGLTRARLNLALGFPYLGLAAVALPWLRADKVAGLANTAFVLAIVWASDIGAYMIGRLVGGPKLAPTISPGKTWSGAIGGLVSAALAGLVVARCLSVEFSFPRVIGLALAFGIVSQAGDLFESALKRHFGVKDSGRIIPGHGGVLDRVDALLAVAPVAALVAFSVGRGVVLWR